jgi:hypothetical protein
MGRGIQSSPQYAKPRLRYPDTNQNETGMYLIPIGWLYVALMMSVAEATNSNGTVLGAVVTFVLYGLLPVGLILYFIGRRRPTRRPSSPPNAGAEAPADAVAPVREEP